MAATLTVQRSFPIGNSAVLDVGTVTMDSSYPTGGEAIDATGDLGYDLVLFEPAGGVNLEWDKANQKVKARWNGDATPAVFPEVTNTTDLSAIVAQFVAIRST